MAHLTEGLTFTGPISNLTAYKMRGSNKIILRTKGGATKEQIRNDPNFVNTRRVNAEFGGRATATRWVRSALVPLLPLADYNIAGPINALLKPIQELDTTNDWGKRAIHFTKEPGLLQGFQLNQGIPFDQIVRNPLTCDISKEECTAQIDIPLLVPGINFHVPGKYTYFGITVVLGILPDLDFNERGYKPATGYAMALAANQQTEWHLVSTGSVAQTIQLSVKKPLADQTFCLMVSVGILFGNPGVHKVEQVRYAGAGKVLAVI